MTTVMHSRSPQRNVCHPDTATSSSWPSVDLLLDTPQRKRQLQYRNAIGCGAKSTGIRLNQMLRSPPTPKLKQKIPGEVLHGQTPSPLRNFQISYSKTPLKDAVQKKDRFELRIEQRELTNPKPPNTSSAVRNVSYLFEDSGISSYDDSSFFSQPQTTNFFGFTSTFGDDLFPYNPSFDSFSDFSSGYASENTFLSDQSAISTTFSSGYCGDVSSTIENFDNLDSILASPIKEEPVKPVEQVKIIELEPKMPPQEVQWPKTSVVEKCIEQPQPQPSSSSAIMRRRNSSKVVNTHKTSVPVPYTRPNLKLIEHDILTELAKYDGLPYNVEYAKSANLTEFKKLKLFSSTNSAYYRTVLGRSKAQHELTREAHKYLTNRGATGSGAKGAKRRKVP